VVLGISEAGEQRHQPTRLPAVGDHVQIGVVTLAELNGITVLAHGQAAEQPQGQALGARTTRHSPAGCHVLDEPLSDVVEPRRCDPMTMDLPAPTTYNRSAYAVRARARLRKPVSSQHERSQMPSLLPNVDPDGLLEYSVVYTDRAVNHMSKAFQSGASAMPSS
jgi:hypothetical protein